MKFTRIDYNKRIVDTENKIPEDEPCFLLRGKDPLSPKLILMWAMELRLRGGSPELAKLAETAAQDMIQYQKDHPELTKTPDFYKSDINLFAKDKVTAMIKDIESGKRVNLSELMDWCEKFWGSDKCTYVLLPMDLKDEYLDDYNKFKLDRKPSFSDFKVTDDFTYSLYRYKMIVFDDGRTQYILKNELE